MTEDKWFVFAALAFVMVLLVLGSLLGVSVTTWQDESLRTLFGGMR